MLDNLEANTTPASPHSALPRALRGCLFLLGETPCAVDVHDAREVIVLGACTPVPGGPPHLVGVANVRGSIVPVVEARPLLGFPARPVTAGTLAMIVAHGAFEAAVPIDRMLGLEWFDGVGAFDEEHAPAPSFVAGFLARGAERFTLLDAGRILAALRTWAEEGD